MTTDELFHTRENWKQTTGKERERKLPMTEDVEDEEEEVERGGGRGGE